MALDKISELLKQTTKQQKQMNIYLGIQGKHLFTGLRLVLNRKNSFHDYRNVNNISISSNWCWNNLIKHFLKEGE